MGRRVVASIERTVRDYRLVKFIVDTHDIWFPDEIAEAQKVTRRTVVKIMKELGLPKLVRRTGRKLGTGQLQVTQTWVKPPEAAQPVVKETPEPFTRPPAIYSNTTPYGIAAELATGY